MTSATSETCKILSLNYWLLFIFFFAIAGCSQNLLTTSSVQSRNSDIRSWRCLLNTDSTEKGGLSHSNSVSCHLIALDKGYDVVLVDNGGDNKIEMIWLLRHDNLYIEKAFVYTGDSFNPLSPILLNRLRNSIWLENTEAEIIWLEIFGCHE